MKLIAPVLLLFLIGCQDHTIRDPVGGAHELTDSPTVVLTSPSEWQEMSLHHLKLGDAAGLINPAKVSSINEKSGWIVLRDANRYRTKDGVIDGLGVWDQRLLQNLGVQFPDDIPAKFGPPQNTMPISTNVTVYEYQDGHLHVFWNSLERRLVGVEVTK
jgi:hypothetical protein